MAIAPDSSSTSVLFSVYNNDEQNLPWEESELLYTNRSQFFAAGFCDKRVLRARMSVEGDSYSQQFSGTCESGEFRVELGGAEALPENGFYNVTFEALNSEGFPFETKVERIVDFRLLDVSSDFVISQPAVDGGITIETTYDISGTCDDAHEISLELGSSSYSLECSDGSWSHDDVPLAVGTNDFQFRWEDRYGNFSTREISLIRQVPGAAIVYSGMPSGLRSGAVAASVDNPPQAIMGWGSMLPFAAQPNTSQPNPLTLESSPAGRGWVIPGNFGRIVNSAD